MTTSIDLNDVSHNIDVTPEFDPVVDESDYCARNAVGLYSARNHGWVIRAAGTAEVEGAVLGCIEDSEAQFELMQLVGGFRWSIHDSFHEALERLLHELHQPGNERLFDNELDPPCTTTIPVTEALQPRPAKSLTETGLPLELEQAIDEWIANISPFTFDEGPGGTR
jgi:hypothetical protein